MKRRLFAIVVALCAVVSFSTYVSASHRQNRNTTKSVVVGSSQKQKNFNVGTFKSLAVSSGIEVIYTVSSKTSVRVEASTPKLLSRVKVVCSDNKLQIGLVQNTSIKNGNNKITAYVSGPALNALSASSGSRFKTKSSLNVTGDLVVNSSSGAEINLMSVSCGNMTLHATSGSEIFIADCRSGASTMTTSSGSEIEIDKIVCSSISSSGGSGSEIEINAANVKGSTSFCGSSGSSFRISGSGSHVDFSVTSGAEVKARRFAAKTGVAIAARSGGDIECNVDRLEQPNKKIKNARR